MKKYAYFTMTCNDLFVPGAIAVVKSLKITKTKHPVYCMVSDEVSLENREKLVSLGCNVVEVPKIHSTTSGEDGDRFEIGRNWLTFTKLNVFNFLEFDKIVYLDADCMVLKNIDDMFEFDTLSGYLLQHTDELEAGVLVLEPNLKHFEELMLYKDKENWKNHDQTLIDWYFTKKIEEFHDMPNEYHFCQKVYHNTDANLLFRQEAKIVEFNGYKPWMLDKWRIEEEAVFRLFDEKLIKLWMRIYHYEFK